MTILSALERLFGLSAEHDGDAKHISAAARRAIVQHELTRGIDLPTWRTPKEIAAMQEAANAR